LARGNERLRVIAEEPSYGSCCTQALSVCGIAVIVVAGSEL
jgi:hypothetical protein